MSKGAYMGINNVAHKIKKGYIGIDGVARKIKKAYIGIGGVARPCWGYGDIVYYGLIYGIYWERMDMVADSNSVYAIFGGGYENGYKLFVDAYNSSLTRTNPENLQCSAHGATHVGDYVVFFCRVGLYADHVEGYNNSLTHIIADTLPVATSGSVTCNKNYALIGGGTRSGYMASSVATNLVYAYDASLKCVTAPSLSKSCEYIYGGSVNEYAVFAGATAAYSYNGSLVMNEIERLTSISRDPVSVSVGNHVLFTGGTDSLSNTLSVVEGYDTSFVKKVIDPLNVDKERHAATTVGDFAIIAGGHDDGSSPPTATNSADSYDPSLTKHHVDNLSIGKYGLSAASIGNYAIFAGGYMNVPGSNNNYYEQNVDAYMVK